MPERVSIHLTGPGRGTVHVGEANVSDLVRGVAITAQAGHLPTVTLDLMAWPVAFDGEADVQLPADVVAMLVRLGWAPPGSVDLGGA
ncbi:hypothetical protein [Saccharothrix lopnurensis]|uniref:Uncharacterized protein n=1 Tax=Saccharothrix lopnurensis TaxID=1670621 RepID=A0ABW1P1X9_9PSEU